MQSTFARRDSVMPTDTAAVYRAVSIRSRRSPCSGGVGSKACARAGGEQTPRGREHAALCKPRLGAISSKGKGLSAPLCEKNRRCSSCPVTRRMAATAETVRTGIEQRESPRWKTVAFTSGYLGTLPAKVEKARTVRADGRVNVTAHAYNRRTR